MSFPPSWLLFLDFACTYSFFGNRGPRHPNWLGVIHFISRPFFFFWHGWREPRLHLPFHSIPSCRLPRLALWAQPQPPFLCHTTLGPREKKKAQVGVKPRCGSAAHPLKYTHAIVRETGEDGGMSRIALSFFLDAAMWHNQIPFFSFPNCQLPMIWVCTASAARHCLSIWPLVTLRSHPMTRKEHLHAQSKAKNKRKKKQGRPCIPQC
ncbi:hypothetical protein BC940DRAFT_34915 [Gongronella butleri]|nr:hypothetical protein BC940DRAFT_34915 [Gongronella butleri]